MVQARVRPAEIDAVLRGVAPEALFDGLVRDTPPGSMGLLLQPTWSPGVRIPGRGEGAIVGFGDVHARAPLCRSILEGLAFALREGGERAASRAKTPLREFRYRAAVLSRRPWSSCTADVFELPTGRPHTH